MDERRMDGDPRGGPVGAAPRSGSRRRWILVLAVLLAPALLVRGCLVGTYVVRSSSMEPGLQAGDQILVLRSGLDPRPRQRWDMAVLSRGVDPEAPDDLSAVVKRVAGLPGEFVELRRGDLHAGPTPDELTLRPRRDELVAAMLVSVHASPDLDAPWSWSGEVPLQRSPSGVRLRAPGDARLASFGQPIRDGAAGQEGHELVADTALRVTLDALDGTLVLGLRDGVDLFRARLAAGGGASLHHNLTGPPLASTPTSPALGSGATILFWNVDDRLRLFVDGRLVLSHDLGPATTQAPGPSLLNAPELGVDGGEALLRRVEVLRDVHYGAQGSHGHPGAALSPYKIPADGLFVLGDASLASRDSRHFGAAPAGAELGRPLAVYGPWARAAWLDADGVRR